MNFTNDTELKERNDKARLVLRKRHTHVQPPQTAAVHCRVDFLQVQGVLFISLTGQLFVLVEVTFPAFCKLGESLCCIRERMLVSHWHLSFIQTKAYWFVLRMRNVYPALTWLNFEWHGGTYNTHSTFKHWTKKLQNVHVHVVRLHGLVASLITGLYGTDKVHFWSHGWSCCCIPRITAYSNTQLLLLFCVQFSLYTNIKWTVDMKTSILQQQYTCSSHWPKGRYVHNKITSVT